TWLLKEPLASLLLFAAGLWALRARPYPNQVRLFLLLPPAVILLAHALFADDLGIRYLLPALPFTCLAGGIGAAWLITRPAWWTRGAAAILALWLAAGAVAIYPDQLSYFNESACLLREPAWVSAAGGTRCGPLWLDDSNVDWGQGLPQLRQWLDVHAPGRPLRLAYFGSFPPESYLPNAQPLSIDDLLKPPAPGLYAVSAHFIGRVPAIAASEGIAGGAWLARTAPVAIAGHAFYIYEIPPAASKAGP
ncbi:MAG: hypothetical protein KGN36_02620, partial [Acidobacteriota bacterium]|nr:hypothetical protein [Acidobacteriota bacterium]